MAASYVLGADAPSMPETYSGQGEESIHRTASRPIIVATDGTDASEPGIAAAATLARELRAPVQLVSVIQPLRALLPATEGLPIPSLEDRETAERRLQLIRAQTRSQGGGDSWTAEIKFGDPATVITRLAKARRARVVVMGRRSHGRVDQLLGDDTVFDVMRLAEVPVLVTTAGLPRPPRVVTVATDFSSLSTAAARAALEIAPSAGLFYLVHVEPGADGMGQLVAEYGTGVKRGFEQMIDELDRRTGARIDTVELSGTPAREIVDFAGSSRSELLVVGSYHRGLFRRLAGGAMASRLMRAAPCPVLIVPEAAMEDELEPGESEEAVTMPVHGISATLDSITLRNAGRRVLFETDNAAVGAQLLAFDYVFLAAEYDEVSARTNIALADDAEQPCNRLSHTTPCPADVEVRRAIDGSDHTVRLVSDCGQVVLTFW